MGRYRPPSPKSSHYITPEGRQKLADEFDYLWRKKRPEVTQALSEAAAEGDRSENAEYIYRKKQLAEIDRRVRYLTKRLDELVVVDRKPDNESQIFFGAWVELENESGDILRYRIVGPDEFDVDKSYISMDSPVAKALMRKFEGDEIEVISPNGKMSYSILEVRYEVFD
ncbi:MAG: transcription elongation factor GreB [Gammaproteobacteria bacterium]|nr:transcription elongation factor GreB [Gammaproteobacteria bacterium]MCW8911640.1 transcription elongation factor GreB [Gammaproteobacteria bacterium]MCW9003681.1 transcription elongation factor GreB [Gammaproteobacteria bacterium]MCW9055784.1 transcription elongation factor GreB [Gammaproteobacteria bacterium]